MSSYRNEGPGPMNNNTDSGTQQNNTNVGLGTQIIYNGDAPPITEDACLNSLAFSHMRTRGDINPRTDGTCEWILRHPEYRDWTANGGILWLKGRAGSGKSTLMQLMLDSDKRCRPSLRVASFFFHRRGAPLQYTPEGLYRSLLHQVLSRDAELLSQFCKDTKFAEAWEHQGNPDKSWHWTKSDLHGYLKEYIGQSVKKQPLRLYIDALDESGEDAARSLMSYLEQIMTSNEGRLSICVSCRPYPDAVWRYRYLITAGEENKQDIESFLRSELEDALDEVWSPPDIVQFAAELAIRSAGIFQWAIHAARRIRSLRDFPKQTILKNIENLPDDLGEVYKDMFSSLKGKDLAWAVPLLRWITFAIRPLSVTELRYAVALSAGVFKPVSELRYAINLRSGQSKTSLKLCQESELWCEDDAKMIKIVERLSKGLAKVVGDESATIVVFDHESVNEYMSKSGVQSLVQRLDNNVDGGFTHTHKTLAAVCESAMYSVTYRRANVFDEWIRFVPVPLDGWTESEPLDLFSGSCLGGPFSGYARTYQSVHQDAYRYGQLPY